MIMIVHYLDKYYSFQFQPESPRVSHHEARSAAKKLLRHLKQGEPNNERPVTAPQQRPRISSTGSPAISSKDTNHLSLHRNTQSDNRMELRIKLDVIQKLQSELLQLIDIQDEKENSHLKLNDLDSSLNGHQNSSQNDEKMKELVEEHSNLLKKTLLISARNRSGSIDLKTPHRGELALDLNGSINTTHGTWPNFLKTDEDGTSSPRYASLSSRSRNLSKENINHGNAAGIENSTIESFNSKLAKVQETEKALINVSDPNHQETSQDMSGLQSLVSTIMQPSTYPSTSKDCLVLKNEETSDSINNEIYETIAALNEETIYSLSQDMNKEASEPKKEIAEQMSSVVDVSETVQCVLNCVSKNNPANINTSELAESIAADLNPEESAALQASVEAILVASATPEIHSQYELATIEEQPELGYQSDSSDTETMMMASGGKGKSLKRKSLVKATCSTDSNSKMTEDDGKPLAPVIEDMMEGTED